MRRTTTTARTLMLGDGCRGVRVLACLLLGAAAATVFAAEPMVPRGELRAALPARVAKPTTSVYLVRLKSPAAASYVGGEPGMAATRPAPGQRLDRRDSKVESYVTHLEQAHDALLSAVGAQGSKIYSFGYAMNGFAAMLTPAQAAALAQNELVDRVWLDKDHKVQTNNSSVFLGLLDPTEGLRAGHKLTGEGVVVGVIDSGIATDHPSLLDVEENMPRACRGSWATSSWLGLWLCRNYKKHPPLVDLYDPPAEFAGTCQIGEGFDLSQCNDKVVGARYYIDGFLARHELDDGEFVSPKDADGHGTHIATTIAGNSVSATLFGTRVARISGIAPRAHIAVYKACWLEPGELRATCTTADLARAIDDAVADGVDIINYSVGSLETALTDPDDMALLNAFDAGVLSVVAAGNDGPDLGTIGSPSSAPWVMTVAASTQSGTAFEEGIDITAPTDIAGRIPMREANFTPSLSSHGGVEKDIVLVDDDVTTVGNGRTGTTRDACEALVNGSEVSGKIALIQRGNCDFDVKLQYAEQAGAVAAIVYNDAGSPFAMNGRTNLVNIPAVMIGASDGQRLVNKLVDDAVVAATIDKGLFLDRNLFGNEMADFSSRGPALSEADFLKPDVTAPGVDILAGHTRDAANGLRGEDFQYLSGTSMSTPHVAGLAALLKQAHPEWSPGVLKSALMTTAYQDVVNFDLETPAHPFDMGAGHVDGNRAYDPGLVYDTDFLDHAAYLCGLDEPPFPTTECDILAQAGYSFAAREVNLPSIGVTELIPGDLVTRRVTNLGAPATYRANVSAPFGVDLLVEPSVLTLGTGESGDFSITFGTSNPDLDLWTFGALEWTDDAHIVRSPLAVRPVTMRVTRELNLFGTDGEGTFEADFGYTGSYDVSVHGLNPPFYMVEDAYIEEDTTNNFSFRTGGGVARHDFNVGPNDLYLRIATFDELTDGNDDLDLYLYFCADGVNCVQVAESGSFTSEEEIDLELPEPGQYALLVHGYETDSVAGGPGARYSLFAWVFSSTDDQNNLGITIPVSVADGDRYDLGVQWQNLDPAVRYFGGILHYTPNFDQAYELTTVTARTP